MAFALKTLGAFQLYFFLVDFVNTKIKIVFLSSWEFVSVYETVGSGLYS